MELVADPDEVVFHAVNCCCGCGADLSKEDVIELARRQVFEMPAVKVNVTEHQTEAKRCPECGMLNRATFPAEVGQKVQYGARLKGLSQYLMHYQLLPIARTQELFADLIGHQLSDSNSK